METGKDSGNSSQLRAQELGGLTGSGGGGWGLGLGKQTPRPTVLFMLTRLVLNTALCGGHHGFHLTDGEVEPRVAQWLERHPCTKRLWVGFPVKAPTQVLGLTSDRGA